VRHLFVFAVFLFFASAAHSQTSTSTQSCTGNEKRLHVGDECIPGILFSYLYCLENSPGGGKVEVRKSGTDEQSHSSDLTLSVKGKGVVLSGEASGGYKNAAVTKATRELQESIDPTLAARCERIANQVMDPARATVPDQQKRPSVIEKRASTTPSATNVLGVAPLKVEGVLDGFSCQVASYGHDWAAANRTRISNELYQIYGCSAPRDAGNKEGYNADFHTEATDAGSWKGFAARSTVLYYDSNNRLKAEAVAHDLARRYKHSFVAARGGGQGVAPDWYARVIIVHLRESGL